MRSLLVLLIAIFPWPAFAAGLHADDAWIREAPPGAGHLAGYVRLRNDDRVDLRLTEAASPDFERVEFHHTVEEGGVSRMRRLADLPVPARGIALLAPGGMHLMLIGPRRALRSGDTVEVEFATADGARTRFAFSVRRHDGAATDPHAGHDH